MLRRSRPSTQEYYENAPYVRHNITTLLAPPGVTERLIIPLFSALSRDYVALLLTYHAKYRDRYMRRYQRINLQPRCVFVM